MQINSRLLWLCLRICLLKKISHTTHYLWYLIEFLWKLGKGLILFETSTMLSEKSRFTNISNREHIGIKKCQVIDQSTKLLFTVWCNNILIGSRTKSLSRPSNASGIYFCCHMHLVNTWGFWIHNKYVHSGSSRCRIGIYWTAIRFSTHRMFASAFAKKFCYLGFFFHNGYFVFGMGINWVFSLPNKLHSIAKQRRIFDVIFIFSYSFDFEL